MERKLKLGSPTNHNASERKSAEGWIQMCFPRYYLYDVLRGLNAITIWAERTKQTIPNEAIEDVVTFLSHRFPDGNILIERQAYAGARSLLPLPSGQWTRGPATSFPLLEKVSLLNEVSPFLSQQWARIQTRL
jgi:hypothetical protein